MKYLLLILLYFLGSFTLFSQNKSTVTDGFVQFFYENGKVSSEGTMKNGQPDGYWKTYYPNGVLKSEGNRAFYKLDSVWIFFTEKGDTNQIINYRNAQKNGYFYTYQWNYDSLPKKKGGLISKELYIDDVKQGLSYYYADGKLKRTILYKNGKKTGLSKEFDENGKLISIVEYSNDYIINREFINRVDNKGLKQGFWKSFYPNDKIEKEIYYINDTINGLYKEFSQSGSLLKQEHYFKGNLLKDSLADSTNAIEWKEEFYDNGRRKYYGAFRQGIKIGIHKEYDQAGNIVIAKEYNDAGVFIAEGVVDTMDRRQGKWKYYYETGELKGEGMFKNNLKTGDWIYYYMDGKIEQKGKFNKDKIDSKWLWYYPNGKVWREEYYELGKEEGSFTEYNDSGKVILKGQYLDGERTGFWVYQVGDIIEEGKYTEGQQDSIWKSYYSNGRICYKGNYVQGVPDGKFYWYYPNGKIKTEGYYVTGRMEKKWYYFDEEGLLYITILYRNDKEYKYNGVRIKLPKGSFE